MLQGTCEAPIFASLLEHCSKPRRGAWQVQRCRGGCARVQGACPRPRAAPPQTRARSRPHALPWRRNQNSLVQERMQRMPRAAWRMHGRAQRCRARTGRRRRAQPSGPAQALRTAPAPKAAYGGRPAWPPGRPYQARTQTPYASQRRRARKGRPRGPRQPPQRPGARRRRAPSGRLVCQSGARRAKRWPQPVQRAGPGSAPPALWASRGSR